MNYTILKQWKTLDGNYHSSTTDYNDYDSAFGNYHSMFKPMINDTNVATFRITMVDEYGTKKMSDGWTRPTETVEEIAE